MIGIIYIYVYMIRRIKVKEEVVVKKKKIGSNG